MSREPEDRFGRATVEGEWALGVREASGIARLGDGGFFVVDDERGIFHAPLGGKPCPLDTGEGTTDLEGICVTPEGDRAFVLSERGGNVWRFAVNGNDLVGGERLGALPRLARKKNQGWEGLAYVPAGTFVESPELVAVHQARPRVIGFFDVDNLEPRITPRLPKAARKAIGKLNDVTVDNTGRILVLSGASGHIAELRLEDDELRLIHVYCIQTAEDDVPEGITIDREGRVWLCTDGQGMLRRLVLQP